MTLDYHCTMTGKNEKLGSQIGDDGWLAGASHVPSPNQDSRPAGAAIDLVVIHAISLPPGEFGGDGVTQLFTNGLNPDAHPYYAEIANLKVSTHFFIRRDGELIQFVPLTARAWHASCWHQRPCGAWHATAPCCCTAPAASTIPQHSADRGQQ